METKPALVLDGNEFLSKAMDKLAESGTAVIITKKQEYVGIVDDRNLREGLKNINKVRCDSVCVKAPTIMQGYSIEQKINSFLEGHFKALAVVDEKNRPVGAYSRADLLRELLELRIIPKEYVHTIMSSPVFTVQYNDKIGIVKRLMKENAVNHLVVIKNGRPVGIISTHDLNFVKPQARGGRELLTEINNPNEMQVSNFMRDEIPSINEESSLQDTMRKMADGNFSSVLVLSRVDRTVKGILSATDIFRRVLKLASVEPDVAVSGLNESDIKQYDNVKESILAVVKKFSRSFTISSIAVHFKKGKSVYTAHLHLNVDSMPLSISAEEYTVGGATERLASELHAILVKRKGRVADKMGKRRNEGD